MNKVLLFFAFIILTTITNAQDIKGVWDKEEREFVTDNTEYWIEYMIDGYARISKGGFYGLIDSTGSIIIPVEYDYVSNWFHHSEKAIAVSKNGYTGVVDLNNKALVDFKYNGANGGVENGLIAVYGLGGMGMVSVKTGKEVIPCQFSFVRQYGPLLAAKKSSYTSSTQLFDLEGKLISEKKYSRINEFEDGMCMVSANRKYGFINGRGEEVVPMKYDGARNFHDGWAAVRVGSKWTFVNEQGEEMHEPKYTTVEDFSQGMARVNYNAKKYVPRSIKVGDMELVPETGGISMDDQDRPDLVGGNWGLIDINGKTIIEPIYERLWYYTHYDYIVATKNGKKGVLNFKDEILLPFEYEYLDFKEDGIAYRRDGKAGVLDPDLKDLTKGDYRNVSPFWREWTEVIDQYGKYGIVDNKGEVIIDPQYDYIDIISDRHAIAAYGGGWSQMSYSGGKWGMVNRDGEDECAFWYSKLYRLSERFIAAQYRGKYGIIDSTGRRQLPYEYDNVALRGSEITATKGLEVFVFNTEFELLRQTSEAPEEKQTWLGGKLYSKQIDENSYIVNGKGEKVSDQAYDKIEPFNRATLSRVEVGGKIGFIDLTGELILKLNYDSVGSFNDGICVVKKGAKYGLINMKGDLVLKCKYKKIGRTSDIYFTVKLKDKYAIVSKSGKLSTDFISDIERCIPQEGNFLIYRQNNQYGFIEPFSGKVLVKEIDGFSEKFYDGMCIVKKGDKNGFVDYDGNLVIPCIYERVGYFNEGRARVQLKGESFVIDKNGKRI